MVSRIRLVWIISLLVVIGVSFLIYRQGIRPRMQPDSNEVMAEEGARAYAKLHMVKTNSPETIRQALEEAQIVRDGLVSEVKAQALMETVSEFLWYRFGAQSIKDYEQWRRDSGYRFRPITEIESVSFAYKKFFRKPLPDDQSVEKLFEDILDAWNQCEGGDNRICGLAANQNGLVLNFKKIDKYDPSPPWPYEVTSRPDGAIAGIEKWSGGRSLGSQDWWEAPTSASEIIEDRGFTIAATLSAIMEFEGGFRLPVAFSFYLDPYENVWRLYTICISNYSQKKGHVIVINY